MVQNNRVYLDYNSTSPLDERVISSFSKGGFLFSNPSSQHTSGKKINHEIKKVKDLIRKKFSLDHYQILFHGGATEGLNTVLNLAPDEALIYFTPDHPCIHSIASQLKAKGVTTTELGVEESGQIDLEGLLGAIENLKDQEKSIHIVITLVNSETGIRQKNALLEKLVKIEGCCVHVDAVQLVGRYKDISMVDGVSSCTFSGHKFGSLKGIGFTLFHPNFSLRPILFGGGQQAGLRGGTLNTDGILSLGISLDQDWSEICDEITIVKKKISILLDKNSKITQINNHSVNTITWYHQNKKSDELLIYFDMAGLDVSAGTACSSGAGKPSLTLRSMGLEKFANNRIRFSLGKNSLKEEDLLLKKLEEVLAKL